MNPMRLFRISFFSALLFISCTRSNQPAPSPTPPVTVPDSLPVITPALPLLDSFKIYSVGPKEITAAIGKLKYDAAGRLTDLYETTTDTTMDGQPLSPDTLDFSLIYHGTDSLPSAYINYTASLSTFAEHGFLSYDNQGRMIQDSGSNVNTNWLRNYQYSPTQINEITGSSKDSMMISGHNVLSWTQYRSTNTFTYAAYPNPFYQPSLADHIAPLMVFHVFDIFSKNLFISTGFQFVNINTNYSNNFSWTTNAKGLVISGIGTDAKTGASPQYFWFTYR
jgi:hypothetical protein